MRSLSVSELSELYDVVYERMNEVLLPALTRANRTDELETLLMLLGLGELVGDDGSTELGPTHVLVLGATEVKEPKLRSIARKNGADPSLFDSELGYSRLKHFNFDQLRYGSKYRAVMVGPMPHSTPGNHGASSAIAEMQERPDVYPPVIELRDSTGLKITNNSFARGVAELTCIAA